MGLRWTPEQLAAHQARVIAQAPVKIVPTTKPSKYSNKPTEVDGILFDSAKEANRYQTLKLMERSGAISDLRYQVPYVLAPGVRINGRMRPPIRYFADFVYVEDGKVITEDSKGMRNRVYVLKRHLLALQGIEIRET